MCCAVMGQTGKMVGENAEMENRNQHMQHAKSGAMRGVAAQPAQQQHVALRHASAPGKQKRAKDKKQKSTQKKAERSALHGGGT